MLDLKRLQHLLALNDERHFVRAAQRVHLSQSAFSRSIQALESQAGMPLFEREAGAIRPTPAGEFLIERARRLLFEARCVERDVGFYRDSRLGSATVGVGPLPALTLMPEVVRRVRRDMPQIDLRIDVNNWRGLLDQLQDESIELLVADVRELPADAALDVRPLGRQSAGFYVRPGHPLLGQTPALSDAWSFGVASVRLPEEIRRGLARLMALPGGELPTLALQCDDIALLRTTMLSTDTVLALTDAALGDDLRSGVAVPLVIRDLPPMFAEMGVARLRNRTPSPAARLVLALIETQAERVNSDVPPRPPPQVRRPSEGHGTV